VGALDVLYLQFLLLRSQAFMNPYMLCFGIYEKRLIAIGCFCELVCQDDAIEN